MLSSPGKPSQGRNRIGGVAAERVPPLGHTASRAGIVVVDVFKAMKFAVPRVQGAGWISYLWKTSTSAASTTDTAAAMTVIRTECVPT